MKKFKFTLNGKEYAVEVKKYEGENAEVVVDGNEYKVKYREKKSLSKLLRQLRALKQVQLLRWKPRPKPLRVRLHREALELALHCRVLSCRYSSKKVMWLNVVRNF